MQLRSLFRDSEVVSHLASIIQWHSGISRNNFILHTALHIILHLRLSLVSSLFPQGFLAKSWILETRLLASPCEGTEASRYDGKYCACTTKRYYPLKEHQQWMKIYETYPQQRKCFRKKCNVSWPLRGESSCGHAVSTAATHRVVQLSYKTYFCMQPGLNNYMCKYQQPVITTVSP